MTNTANVALGKPKIGGAIFRYPRGTVIPKDAKTPLPPECIEQGYVTDSGLERAISRSYDSIKVWGGDEAANPKTEETIRVTFSLAEANNVEALVSAFGRDAVTVKDGVTTVTYRGDEVEDSGWVIDMAYKGQLRRMDYPLAANVTEDFTQSFTDEAIIELPFELAIRRDENGDFFHDYMEGATNPKPEAAKAKATQ
jgi:hypothetical protein